MTTDTFATLSYCNYKLGILSLKVYSSLNNFTVTGNISYTTRSTNLHPIDCKVGEYLLVEGSVTVPSNCIVINDFIINNSLNFYGRSAENYNTNYNDPDTCTCTKPSSVSVTDYQLDDRVSFTAEVYENRLIQTDSFGGFVFYITLNVPYILGPTTINYKFKIEITETAYVRGTQYGVSTTICNGNYRLNNGNINYIPVAVI